MQNIWSNLREVKDNPCLSAQFGSMESMFTRGDVSGRDVFLYTWASHRAVSGMEPASAVQSDQNG